MAFKSQFFNSIDNDRPYSAEDMARAFDTFQSSGVMLRHESVYPEQSFVVFCNSNSNNKIVVAPGKAVLKGYTVSSIDAGNMPIIIEAGDGTHSRKDLVVLEMNVALRDITLKILKGNTTSHPVPIQTNNVYQLPLAEVISPKGYVSGNDSTLTINDKRQWSMSGSQGFKKRTYSKLVLNPDSDWKNSKDNPLSYSILPNGLIHIQGIIYHGFQSKGIIITWFPSDIDFPATYWEPVLARSFNNTLPAVTTHSMDIQNKATSGGNARLVIGLGHDQNQDWAEVEWVSINIVVPVIYTGNYMWE
jgi:hypothetical protein